MEKISGIDLEANFMKIIVTVRTRDEEENIEKFVEAYQWADQILVADGGSYDRTVDIARFLPKTKVKNFTERHYMTGKLWRNPHGKHMNFLFDWAEEEGADWIIFDDCDCRPNYLVKDEGRGIFEEYCKDNLYDLVNVTRIYVWKDGKHFPKLAKPNKGEWSPSLWAWRAGIGIRASEANPKVHYIHVSRIEKNKRLNLMPPFCLLHDYYQKRHEKVSFYKNSGQHPSIVHPLNLGMQLESLPEWARE